MVDAGDRPHPQSREVEEEISDAVEMVRPGKCGRSEGAWLADIQSLDFVLLDEASEGAAVLAGFAR